MNDIMVVCADCGKEEIDVTKKFVDGKCPCGICETIKTVTKCGCGTKYESKEAKRRKII